MGICYSGDIFSSIFSRTMNNICEKSGCPSYQSGCKKFTLVSDCPVHGMTSKYLGLGGCNHENFDQILATKTIISGEAPTHSDLNKFHAKIKELHGGQDIDWINPVQPPQWSLEQEKFIDEIAALISHGTTPVPAVVDGVLRTEVRATSVVATGNTFEIEESPVIVDHNGTQEIRTVHRVITPSREMRQAILSRVDELGFGMGFGL